MLKQFIRGRLAAAERDYGYDVSYLRALLDADLQAFIRFSKLQGVSQYRRDVPADVCFAAKIVGTMVEDCGPCTQLMVTMAERAGVAPQVLRAVLQGDLDALSAEVRLGVEFARASLAHDPAADALRERVVERWGKRGLVTLAFGLVGARVYPTLKYALGYGRACSRVVVGGQPLRVREPAPTSLSAPA